MTADLVSQSFALLGGSRLLLAKKGKFNNRFFDQPLDFMIEVMYDPLGGV